jgi:hypothetical protein
MDLKNFSPLSNFLEIYSCFYLFYNKSINDIDQITHSLNQIFAKSFNSNDLKHMITKIHFCFNIDSKDIFELTQKLNNCLNSFKKRIFPPVVQCIKCWSLLKNLKSKDVCVYYIDGPQQVDYFKTYCQKCNISYGIDTYVDGNNKYFYPLKIATTFIETSNQTVFHKDLISHFDEFLIRNNVTFSGYVDSYNARI